MKPVLTAAQMRALERASSEWGVSDAELMEHAGAALAAEVERRLHDGGQVLIACGAGNNGGDGLVAARLLEAGGHRVRRWLTSRRQASSPGEVHAPWADAEVGKGDVVVDALLGTGLNRPADPEHAGLFERIAAWRGRGAQVISVDLPSGLHADNGQAPGSAVAADVTVAFGALKLANVLAPGVGRCGAVQWVDIGIPPEAWQAVAPARINLLEEGDVSSALPAREADSHKGTYGHVLCLAGSRGKSGAAALCAKAALRTGAGLVTVATRAEALPEIVAHAPELMGEAVRGEGPISIGDLERLLSLCATKQALVIGPGLPRGDDTGELLEALLSQVEVPAVLDADALNAVGTRLEGLRSSLAPLVLTPHPGEMGRLLGTSTAEVQRDRLGAARRAADRARATVVLKGARTLIATPDGEVFINPTGNAGMSTGGTGDVLAGMIGALLAQGCLPLTASQVAVYAHGRAGDLAAARRGELGLIASDVIDALGTVWVGWKR